MPEIYTYQIEGIPVKTGDLICTTNGSDNILAGEFWWFVGKFIPGAVDHVAIYVGPDGWCIEAGPKGVSRFKVEHGRWRGEAMMAQRGFVDRLHGIAYALQNHPLGAERENAIRFGVSQYCQRQVGKSYNCNFLDPDAENCFYCSQLAYMAYKQFGIDLNTGPCHIPGLPASTRIVFPQEIWDLCAHQAAQQTSSGMSPASAG